MSKSIIFWGGPLSGKSHNADLCSLLFDENKIIESTAKEFKPENFLLKDLVGNDLIIIDECFEEEQIHELEVRIRKAFTFTKIRVIYLFQNDTAPIFMSDKIFHIIKCDYYNKIELELSELNLLNDYE